MFSRLLIAALAAHVGAFNAPHSRTKRGGPVRISGFIDGIFGKKTAEITRTCFFDIEIDGAPAGRLE